ncbi:MAG: hypothetical protein ABSG92_06595 [Conexivisphaerales archaeon]|jgi:hypothetical protein
MGEESEGTRFEFKLPERDAKLVKAFRAVADELMGEELDDDGYFGLLIAQGMSDMLRTLLTGGRGVDSESSGVLWSGVEKLFYRYPEEVANFIVESMKEEAAQETVSKMREDIKLKDMYD